MKIFENNKCITLMTSNKEPSFYVNDGETFVVNTLDCFSGKIKDKSILLKDLPWELINPATGPIYVNGAEKGDVLKVSIIDIKLGNRAVILREKEDLLKYYFDAPEESIILAVNDGIIHLSDDLTMTIEPMIGVIGTVPESEDIPTTLPGVHGGNMDNTHIRIGSIVYLPVFHDGALLALGDLHAAMGDGESTGSGLEIDGAVTLKVEVIKNCSRPLPMIENEHMIETVASANTLDEAARKATELMLQYLVDNLKLDSDLAWTLVCANGNVGICQFANAIKTARCGINKSLLLEL